MAIPAELVLALGADHVAATSVLGDEGPALRTGHCEEHLAQVAPSVRSPQCRPFAEQSLGLVPTRVLRRVLPSRPALPTYKLLSTRLLHDDPRVEAVVVGTRDDIGGVMEILAHVLALHPIPEILSTEYPNERLIGDLLSAFHRAAQLHPLVEDLLLK